VANFLDGSSCQSSQQKILFLLLPINTRQQDKKNKKQTAFLSKKIL